MKWIENINENVEQNVTECIPGASAETSHLIQE
jgi:hypothetical protein